jgi:hypothetical protein
MATPTTISQTLPAPILEGALTAFTKKLEPLIGQQIQTSAYAPQIAAESQLQQQARTSAGGLESLLGPQAYQQFMSPYQQEVIDTTLAEMDRQAAIQRQGIGQSAIQAGAFGGGREGVQMAEYDVNTLARRAQTQAQLLQQGYLQAQQQAQQQLAAQQGLGAYQTQLGQAGQAQQQAVLRRSTSRSKRSSIRTIYKIRFSGTTTCTNSTRCISNSNSWLSTTTSSS